MGRELHKPKGTAVDPTWLFWLAVVLAIAVRIPLLSFESHDYRDFTRGWYEAIRQGGGLEALRGGVSNYTPVYVYGLILIEWLFPSLAPAVAIKLVGLPFDFVCAWFVGGIAQAVRPHPWSRRLAMLAVLLAPTVILNGSYWGQVDSIWSAAVAACVYFALVDRPRGAAIAFGCALAFKLQAIFLLPFLVLGFAWGFLNTTILWVPVLVYGLAVLPAWLAGRPILELLTVYVAQAGYYERLTSNAAHVFQWLPGSQYAYFAPAGTLWAAAAIAFLLAAVLGVCERPRRNRLVALALLSVLVVPYLLPKMHERYFFGADVLSVAYAIWDPRMAWAAIMIQAVSLFSYSPFLFGATIVPLPILAIVQGGLIVVLAYRFVTHEAD